MNHLKSALFVLCFTLSVSLLAAFSAQAATVVIYHHVSDKTPASTSLSLEKFVAHLDLFEELNLTVVPLSQIVNAIKSKQEVKNDWIALTFDDGFRSVYDNALPELKKRNLPFTVFVNPDMVKPSKLFMDWDQLKELTHYQGELANHTLAHQNLVQDGLTREQIKQNLLSAEQAITKMTGQSHRMVAFPFGEYNDTIKSVLLELDMVGFAQHSGAIDQNSDLQALTRFPAAGIYANPKTLKNKARSLPFSIEAITPTDTVPGTPQPKVIVKLIKKDFYKSQLACFISGQSKAVKPTWIDDLTFEVQAAAMIGQGRIKYNCTAPSISHAGRYYWMSKLWINLTNSEND